MTKQEIIRETVEFYKNNPRSIRGLRCVYVGYNREMCAFARVCKNPTEEWDGINDGSIYSDIIDISRNFGDGNVDNLVKDEYKGHDMDFWTDIQLLYDVPRYWNKGITTNTLTKSGEIVVEYLLQKYSN